MQRKRVGILLFPGVEVLDFCGPFEVFSVTRCYGERVCRATARQMEYPFRDDNRRRL